MTKFFEDIGAAFQLPIAAYGLVVGALVALCASLLGVTLVLKRFSMIGDGLSHSAFGATAIASVLGLTNNTLIVLPITVLVAIILLQARENKKIKGDALIAMMSVGALAIGYLLLNVFKVSTNVSGDVCTTLFGGMSILTLSMTDVWISIALSVLVIAFFIVFYNKIFAITFDETFARAAGTKAGVYNTVIAIIVAVVVVVAMKLVGSLLVSALVIFPALSAMRVFRSFKAVTIASAIISVACTCFGYILSIPLATPVGPTIIVIDIVVFFAFFLGGFIARRKT